jgi:short-subunit dehydrogenase
VTGATSGFGFGLVEALLPLGHRVIATGRDLQHRPEIFSQLRQSYPHQLIEKDLDVTSGDQRRKIVEFLESSGPLDVLINNAGYGLFGPLELMDETKIRHQMEVNFIAPTLLIRDILPFLRHSKGHVINITSVLGFVGFPLASLYCASKFALEGLTESLSYELSPHGVRFSVVQPGSFKTKFDAGTQWASNHLEESNPYSGQVKSYRLFREKNVRRVFSNDPNLVVARVVKLIQSEGVLYRLTIGLDAIFSRALKGLLPAQLSHRLIKTTFARTFRPQQPEYPSERPSL